ncbi:MAG: glycosyltransferase [Paraprevotella sp.]|nr:glycosyltransferase [Paraprevotella sp.]
MLISIIIPVYNASSYLRECIESLFAQSFTDFEVIFVDDGSTDDSLEICQLYAGAHENISVIEEDHSGVSVARNKGLDAAKGEWVTFVDADDCLMPCALDVLYGRACESRANVVLANAVRWKDGVVSLPILKLTRATLPCTVYAVKHCALWGYLIRNNLVRDQGLRFVEGLAYSEDRVFLYELARFAKTIAYTDEVVYLYRINPTSACASPDGLRKAIHQFRAGCCVWRLAETFLTEDRIIYKFLRRQGWHLMGLGIYSFLLQKREVGSFQSMRAEYYRCVGKNSMTLCGFYYYAVKAYLSIKRRRIIKIRKT